MTNPRIGKSLLVLVGLAAACATPSAELIEARKQYTIASRGIANETVPARVLEAKQALEKAEKAHDSDDGSFEERSYAYLASRKALIAMSEGRRVNIEKSVLDAEKEYLAVQSALLEEARREVSFMRGDLRDKSLELGAERHARRQVEASLNQTQQQLSVAMRAVKGAGKLRRDKRGTVITLDGTGLFASGSARLLATAHPKLVKVAKALTREGGKHIVIVGYTDDRGRSSDNVKLPRARAKAVRRELIGLGVSPRLLTAVGRGQGSPIASNRSAEGRANNRRSSYPGSVR